MALTAGDFAEFFRELWGPTHTPFPWQEEFAKRLCSGKAPDYVSVPTGSGKTACLDAAIFALAVQSTLPIRERTQGRRIFFIVNRRVIVDEAYDRAETICKKLRDAPPDTLVGRVAAQLQQLTGDLDSAPLAALQLRGGIYRDRSWANSLLQPMVVCSTVDQTGSRLLFRGYGVSPQARPIHAALVAQDSLLIVDEAHISQPFIQTVEWVKHYRLHQFEGGETLHLPFQLIQMTATPPANTPEDQQITLSPSDHEHPVLKPRLTKPKPARLVHEDKAKGKLRNEQMAKRLISEAEQILDESKPRSLAIMVNRVSTARSVAGELSKKHPGQVCLLIGRLRPLDRDAVTKELRERLKTDAGAKEGNDKPLVVVSTQCLEVGADLDFDSLVTEAASLDSLRQRFGRLNRGGRPISAQAVIVLPEDQNIAIEKLDEAAPCDPIYGNAIPRTWAWLENQAQGDVVDFGINAMNAKLHALNGSSDDTLLKSMLSPTGDAPILLPAYLDCWVQTNPTPAADPDVSLFLHGAQRDMAEVQVCWRGDLPNVGEAESHDPNFWADILSLCPPNSTECLPVPLHVFQRWVTSRGDFQDLSSDVEEITAPMEDKKKPDVRRGVSVLVWRGPKEQFFLRQDEDLRPGDTVILRAQDGGWEALGFIPNAPTDPQTTPTAVPNVSDVRSLDLVESATATSRNIAVLRVHPALWPPSEKGTAAARLLEMSRDRESAWSKDDVKALLKQLAADEVRDWSLTEQQRAIIEFLGRDATRLSELELYPGEVGFVISSRDRLPSENAQDVGEIDSEALLEANRAQELHKHTQDVLTHLHRSLTLLPIGAWKKALMFSATTHDWGKADSRFQAMLRGTTPFAALASGTVLAKSGSLSSSMIARQAVRKRAELPDGFRHEMLSVSMAETCIDAHLNEEAPKLKSLSLHLVATHHGYGRPFVPVTNDTAPPDVSLLSGDSSIMIASQQRTERPVHALDFGVTRRFWEMNRHYGWWGVAFLETVLRLADQSASAKPSAPSNP